MCYPKPGPRCSAHAKEEVKKAKDFLKQAQNEDNPNKLQGAKERLKKAYRIWNSTPEGQKNLSKKAEESVREQDSKYFNKLLEQGQELRKQQFQNMKNSKKQTHQRKPNFSPESLEKAEEEKTKFINKLNGFNDEDKQFLTQVMEFSETMHNGQKRLEGKEKIPYIIHPLQVANYLLDKNVKDRRLISVALLHDTVEDCSHKIVKKKNVNVNERMRLASDEISTMFDKDIGDDVFDLSNPSLPKKMDISEKRKAYHDHARKVLVDESRNYYVPVVKFADFYNNAGRINPSDGTRAHHFYAKYQPMLKIFKDSFNKYKNSIDPQLLSQLNKDMREVSSNLSQARKELFG